MKKVSINVNLCRLSLKTFLKKESCIYKDNFSRLMCDLSEPTYVAVILLYPLKFA